jgi:hypothetical protein
MRNRIVSVVAVVLLVSFSSLTFGQAKFDPRDFSGYWLRNTVRPKQGPPLTPAGLKAKEGRRADDDVKLPTDSNDPMYKCNPQGFPRLVWEENEPLEFITLPDRVLQLFQWERTLRELWVDGRELPSGENLENLGAAWYGHSAGHWEGDTLVVLTTGVDERAWLDEYANPKSFDARFEERYRMIDANTIEGQLTINDPKNFTAPWVHPPSLFKRMKPEDVNFFGWKGLFSGLTDAICAPMNETNFDDRIRDPGALGVKK